MIKTLYVYAERERERERERHRKLTDAYRDTDTEKR